MFAACDQCGKKYDVTGKRAGAAFRCPACKQGSIKVPDATAATAEPAPPQQTDSEGTRDPAPASAGAPRHATKRATGREPAKRAPRVPRAHHETDAPAKKKPPIVAISVGGAVIAVALAYILTGGGNDAGNGKANGAGGGAATTGTTANGGAAKSGSESTSPAGAGTAAGSSLPASDPRAAYTERLARIEKKDAAGRAELAQFCDQNGLRSEARQLRREALLLDSDNESARVGLGFQRYQGKVPQLQGRWLDKADLARAANAEKYFDAGALKQAATTQDVFVRNCETAKKKMIAEFPEEKWLYAYGKDLMPQPFFVVIERPKDEATLEARRTEYAEILSALYDVFFERYEKRFKLERDIERPIRVIMFEIVGSYAAHRTNHPEGNYADPASIGGYYQPWEQRLIMWRPTRGESGLEIKQVLFHEGTHLFVHYAFSGKGFTPSKQTPWLQEGIAELFAGHTVTEESVAGRKVKRFELNRFLPGRYSGYRMMVDGDAGLSVHELVKLDNYTFEKAKTDQAKGGVEGMQAGLLVGQVYAFGWVFCMYLNHAEGGKWKNALDDYLEAETKGEGYWQKLGELLGLKSAEDWAALDEKVREWAKTELPKLK